MNEVSREIIQNKKIACITIDIERDYGDRIEEFNILENKEELANLGDLYRSLETPVSAFITTDMLLEYPEMSALLKSLTNDYHCHSHTHNTKTFDSEYEISTCAETFEKVFGFKPIGYRAPQGVLYDNDIEILKACDFKFSSSIFPSYRHKKFNNLKLPINPYVYDNGIIEMPFSVLQRCRLIVSLSYIKLFGINAFKALVSLFELPNIIVFDSHLHDYIVNEKSFENLPKFHKAAWGRNKYKGNEYFSEFVSLLKSKGYTFVTMTELYEYLKKM